MDARTIGIVLLVAGAPIAIVLLVALLRGYAIDLHMVRRRGRDDQEDP